MTSWFTKLLRKLRNSFSSIDYWERRYQSGGNSGSGSYNKLASYKSEFINAFISSHGIRTALEFGCGDGHILSLIHYPSYTGLDVSPTAIDMCTRKFEGDTTKRFVLYKPHEFHNDAGNLKADLTLSIDVIYHLVEDVLFELHMDHLFQCSSKFVMIYSTDVEFQRINHERGRRVSDWVATNKKNWKLVARKENPFANETHVDEKSTAVFFLYQHQEP